ncbi:MAG: glycosyltransferase family 4 protein [Polyangiaceae bacterium]
MDEIARGQRSIRTIAMLGNHLPRHCGIATFTTDLAQAIVTEHPHTDCFVLAMNEPGIRHAYPPRVRFEIGEGDVAAYRRAADFLNVNAVDVLSLQHEYGIFGAKAGVNVLELLRGLRMPIVTTLHTIVASPSPAERSVMDALVALSSRIVVMSSDGAALLNEIHGVPSEKIDLIPHGIPSAPDRNSKSTVDVDGRSVILTFGLIGPDKGIEYVIDALPSILTKHPNTVYVVLGATHPHIKLHHGETYRHMLESRAARLGVAANVIFHNRFVSHEELVEFLSAADIYVTPYLKEEQSTSGTLAYAVGCGKAVISTPYRYARELLSDGRGILVPWRDAGAIAREVTDLLDHPKKRSELQRHASAFGRSMSWPVVARRYVDSFERARDTHEDLRRADFRRKAIARRAPEPPEIDLSHVRSMTDDTGMLQHAAFSVPRYQDGYCTDDNARALLLMTRVEEEGNEAPSVVRGLASRYLAFLNAALDEDTGRFRNFMTYDRKWVEERGSDDSHGRAIWALGAVVGRSLDFGRQQLARNLFHAALRTTPSLTSPRAWAFAMLGVDEYLGAFRGDSNVESVGAALAEKLLERFRCSSMVDWPWFEDRLTYENARLSQAIMSTGAWMENEEMIGVGLRSLEWLAGECTAIDGSFSPVGSNGFHVRGRERAAFDQQPVEACAMVSACLDAGRISGQARWTAHARRAFEWFFGQNPLNRPVFDAMTGGCRDGIHVDRMNENQGAESTLSFLQAVAEMRSADRLASRIALVEAGRSKPRLDQVAAALYAEEGGA